MTAEGPVTGPAGAVGEGHCHVVQPGDCISSIALDYGHFWKTLWDHPKNATLKRVRKNPNVLLAGDEVFVPKIELREEPGATERRHRFLRKGEPAQIKLILMHGNRPRKNEEYILDIDGKLTRGSTGADGSVTLRIPGNARRGKITVGPDREEFELQLGGMDPIETLSGVQGRLNNLGYDCGGADGAMTAETAEAIRRFQKDHGLPETGEPDDVTRSRLKELHGC
jgi:hypothetical protein